MQNVAKYAGATSMRVRVWEDAGALAFAVLSDGAGFDTSRTSYGTGLQGMPDRLAALGALAGRRLGEGTTVTGQLPIAGPVPSPHAETVAETVVERLRVLLVLLDAVIDIPVRCMPPSDPSARLYSASGVRLRRIGRAGVIQAALAAFSMHGFKPARLGLVMISKP